MPDPLPPQQSQSLTAPPFVDTSTGAVPDLPTPPDSQNLDTTGPPYMGWGQTIHYAKDTGLVAQAVGGPVGTPSDVVRLHGGRSFKVVSGVAVRIGAKPVIPAWDSQSDNEVLTHLDIATFSPNPGPSGAKVYGVVWRYFYSLQLFPAAADSFDFGRAPYDTTGAETLNPSDFTTRLNGTPTPVSPGQATLQHIGY